MKKENPLSLINHRHLHHRIGPVFMCILIGLPCRHIMDPESLFPPYYNSAVASGHAPQPCMWGPPQPMMPPYGAPYAAIYSHGGVHAHPAVSLGRHSQGHGIPSSPIMQAATP